MPIETFLNCWLCGKRGLPYVGSHLQCVHHPEGPVLWRKTAMNERVPARQIPWKSGHVVDCVDFTIPGAMSSPA